MRPAAPEHDRRRENELDPEYRPLARECGSRRGSESAGSVGKERGRRGTDGGAQLRHAREARHGEYQKPQRQGRAHPEAPREIHPFWVGASSAIAADSSSSPMPQIGPEPGSVRRSCGCIGQVWTRVPASSDAVRFRRLMGPPAFGDPFQVGIPASGRSRAAEPSGPPISGHGPMSSCRIPHATACGSAASSRRDCRP